MQPLLRSFPRWFRQGPPSPNNETVPAKAPADEPAQRPTPPDRETKASHVNPREALDERCHKIAYAEAVASGSPKANPQALQGLESRASGLAEGAHVPYVESREQGRITRMTRLLQDEERQTIDRDRHLVYHADAKRALAELGPEQPLPQFPEVFYYSALIGLSISMTPVFHDLFIGLDSLMKWVAGGVCALGVSVLIVHGILPASPDSNK